MLGNSLKQDIKSATIKLDISTFNKDDITINNFCMSNIKESENISPRWMKMSCVLSKELIS